MSRQLSRRCLEGGDHTVTGCEVRTLGEGVRMRIDGRGNVDLEVQTNNLVPSLEHEKRPILQYLYKNLKFLPVITIGNVSKMFPRKTAQNSQIP